jgi:transposase InsO family protein
MVQRVALAEKTYGYRRVTFDLRRAGVVGNHKRVPRLMHEDNLLDLRQRTFVPATTDANHRWRVVPTDFKPGITLTVHSIVSPLFGLN